MMIDVIGLQHRPGKFRKQIIFFVGRAARSDDADCAAAILVANFSKPLADPFKSFFPGRRLELAVAANERLGEPLLIMGKVESVPTFDAEEIAVDSAFVAVVPTHNLRSGIGAAHAERGLASIAAVSADGPDVVHLPGTRLVAVGSRSE